MFLHSFRLTLPLIILMLSGISFSSMPTMAGNGEEGPFVSTVPVLRYWVFFADRGPQVEARLDNLKTQPGRLWNEAALQKRQQKGISVSKSDLPVWSTYVEALESLPGVEVRQQSRWFNAVSVELADLSVLESIRVLDVVRAIEPVGRYVYREEAVLEQPIRSVMQRSNLDVLDVPGFYGEGWNQAEMIGVDFLWRKGFDGEGMTVAIFDAGYRGMDTIEAFRWLWENNRIVDYWNFQDSNDSIFDFSSHGTAVQSCVTANSPGELVGTAPGVNLCLYITEVAAFENIIEEDHWVAAAERAETIGVDVINTSLGYTTFDDPAQNHTYEDMDGNTTIISRGADMAAKKGMLVVTSAGNAGNNPWYYISAPADGDSVLAVGAVDENRVVTDFSSHGPSSDGDIKPNVGARGRSSWIINQSGNLAQASGTSFSAPIMAGAAASLWQAFPQASNMEIFDAIQRSADQYNNPDDELGYGIPNFRTAYYILEAKTASAQQGGMVFLPNPVVDAGLLFSNDLFAGEALIRVHQANGQECYRLETTLDAAGSHVFRIEGFGDWAPGVYIVSIDMEGLRRETKVLRPGY